MNYITRFHLASFMALLSFTYSAAAEESTLQEKTPSGALGIYFGGFGGFANSSSTYITQKGTAFFSADSGGPMSVNAKGSSNSSGIGFGGLHVGYEWLRNKTGGFCLTPGVELEGYYFTNTKTASLNNPTDRLDSHKFKDSFPMRVGVALINGTLAFTNDYITPYIGVGVGANMVSIHSAKATQVEPPEPGINHFNSDTSAFNWTYALQAKTGLRYALSKYCRIFGEYRFLYLPSTNYTFGSTK
ncbi:MAG: hypothetical protein JSS09_01560, partial [Verrucomicrobia bacterium]|nr:hypothetical protein [Verrucomicrobiota bacterium]